jgi:bacteriorhodopsin
VSLINVFAVLIIIGMALAIINTCLPMDEAIKKIFNALVVIIVILWLLNGFGIVHVSNHMGHLKLFK